MIPRSWMGLIFTVSLAGGCAYDLTNPNQGQDASGTRAGAENGGNQAGACIPGQTAFCTCSDGAQGVQACGNDGVYSTCDCAAASGDPGGTSGDPSGGGGGGTPGVPSGTPDWAPTCTSGQHWTYGSESSTRMYPGRNCVTCHANGGGGGGEYGEDGEEGEWEGEEEGGPPLLLGATVYLGLHDEDDCFGFEGAVVRIDAADGQVYRFTSNAAGNFYRPSELGNIATPYRASVLYDGRELAMQGSQTDPNCANCHTVAGAGGAPGRILVP